MHIIIPGLDSIDLVVYASSMAQVYEPFNPWKTRYYIKMDLWYGYKDVTYTGGLPYVYIHPLMGPSNGNVFGRKTNKIGLLDCVIKFH